jgi:nitroreductase
MKTILELIPTKTVDNKQNASRGITNFGWEVGSPSTMGQQIRHDVSNATVSKSGKSRIGHAGNDSPSRSAMPHLPSFGLAPKTSQPVLCGETLSYCGLVELVDVLKTRRMIRAFSDDPVAPGLIDSILGQSLSAPSAGNTAAVEFLVLEGRAQVDRYWDITLTGPKRAKFRWQQLLDAPTLVLVTTRPDSYPERYAEPDKAHQSLGVSTEQWPIPYWFLDAGCVIQNLLLGVTDAALGACLFGLFDFEKSVAAEFGVPAEVRITATIAIGHPITDEPGRSAKRPRRRLTEVLHRQVW